MLYPYLLHTEKKAGEASEQVPATTMKTDCVEQDIYNIFSHGEFNWTKVLPYQSPSWQAGSSLPSAMAWQGLEVQSNNKRNSAAWSLHIYATISQPNTPSCRVAGEQAFMTSALYDRWKMQINQQDFPLFSIRKGEKILLGAACLPCHKAHLPSPQRTV